MPIQETVAPGQEAGQCVAIKTEQRDDPVVGIKPVAFDKSARSGFDITPFLATDDPWLLSGDDVRGIYRDKYLIAACLQPKSILEIGVRAGYSAAAFLAACPTATYRGIDYYSPNDPYGGWSGARAHAEKFVRSRYQYPITEVLVRCSQDMDKFPKADLIHIDGDHSTQGALHDLELAFAAKPRWILLDDTEHLESVRKAGELFADAHDLKPAKLPTVRGDWLFSLDGDERRADPILRELQETPVVGM